MEFLTKTGIFTSNANAPESVSRLEVYRLSEDEMTWVEERAMPNDEIMEYLGLAVPAYQVEAGEIYIDRDLVAYNPITGLLVIEVRKSLNV